MLCILCFLSCTSMGVKKKSHLSTTASHEENSQLRLCRHKEEREYNPSGHEKNRKATYIRYDNRVAILSKLHDILKELSSLVENKNISKENRTDLSKSIVSLAKQAETIPVENKSDYCPIRLKKTEKSTR